MFTLKWTTRATAEYATIKTAAEKAFKNRNKKKKKKTKASKQEGLFKQIRKALNYLEQNPKHPSLNTHEYDSLPHPWDDKEKVWEAYAQNNTPGAYRIFWCYGPKNKEITIIAITDTLYVAKISRQLGVFKTAIGPCGNSWNTYIGHCNAYKYESVVAGNC